MVNLNGLKVAELKDMCVARGLKATGLKKAELVALLQAQVDGQAGASVAPTPAVPEPAAPVYAAEPVVETALEQATYEDEAADAAVDAVLVQDAVEEPAAKE
eukprot:8315758-Pyramimonas_sp.AAC.1